MQRKLASDPRVSITSNGQERKVPLNDLTAMELALLRSDKMMTSEKMPVTRAKKMKKTTSKTMAVRLTEKEYIQIATEAHELGRTLSSHMRSLLGLKIVAEMEE